METEKKTGIKFGLTGIKILRFNVSEIMIDDQNLSSDNVKNDFTFNYKDLGDNILQLFVHFSLTYNEKNIKHELLHTDVLFQFNVIDLTEKMESDRDFIGVSTLSVAFSTLRGIVFERTHGYSVNQLILPVINPATFWNEIKEKEVQDLHKKPKVIKKRRSKRRSNK